MTSESLPFIESVRQLKWELGKNCMCVHLTYVPYIAAAKEFKTKPTQHSVKQLQELGIQPGCAGIENRTFAEQRYYP